jgi:hypothetical protein
MIEVSGIDSKSSIKKFEPGLPGTTNFFKTPFPVRSLSFHIADGSSKENRINLESFVIIITTLLNEEHRAALSFLRNTLIIVAL